MNSIVIIKEIEFLGLKLQKKISQIYPDGLTVGFYQLFQGLIPIIHNDFQKIEEETLFIYFITPELA